MSSLNTHSLCSKQWSQWVRNNPGPGKAIRACADNYMGAKVVGLDIRHLYALTFGLGAACVAAAAPVPVMVASSLRFGASTTQLPAISLLVVL